MSWWVYLEDPVDPVDVPMHQEGGTYIVGGTTNAELNVTYNYSPHYYRTLDKMEGLQWLDGKSGAEAEPRLRAAVEVLGVERSEDYWEKSEGNAGYALSILLSWACLHPKAQFRVS